MWIWIIIPVLQIKNEAQSGRSLAEDHIVNEGIASIQT